MTVTKRATHQWRARVRGHGYPVPTKTFESEMAGGVRHDHTAAERKLEREALERDRNEITPTHKGDRSAGETYRLDALIEHHISDYALATLAPRLEAHAKRSNRCY